MGNDREQEYKEYKSGHDKGEDDRDAGGRIHVNTWRGDYDGKSDSWWDGHDDGKDGKWDPSGRDDD